METTAVMIGVTGHRDLPQARVAQLAGEVREILRGLQRRHSPVPLMMLSALAEGADRLAARVAWDEGIALIALLPMPRELYEEDFMTPESKAEFRELLGRAVRRVDLPLRGAADPEWRSFQYEDAGKYIAQASQTLIALWDGVNTGKRGGTWQVIEFASGRMPVYQVMTPRS